jgi:phage terminase large subunit-like protein
LNNIFDAAFDAVSGAEWEEIPVMIEEFVTSEEFLNLPPLSDYQYQIIRAGSQIYRVETLVALYGEEEGRKRFTQTCTEVVLQLGKGSGKDYCSTIIVSYIVYLLLCLKDPAKYYGKPSGDTIDILNIAVNADQARNVFFANLRKRIQKCPWFADKGPDGAKIENSITQNTIEFDKSIRVFSGHSEREAFEGLNLFVAVLDEIAAFALDKPTTSDEDKPDEMAKTAQNIYNMYRASVNSRFADFGKVIMLSFPRFKGDFIQQRYEAIIAEKEVINRKYTMKLDPDLPEDDPNYEGNEFDIEWEEDHIVRYAYPGLFGLRRPSWEVNPTIRIDSPSMVRAAKENPGDFLGRYACMPSNLVDGFFKNKQAIDDSFVTQNGVDEFGIYLDKFQPKPGMKYYLHVDLAQKHDKAAVAMAHVDSWVSINVGTHYKEIHPVVQVDCVRWWTPSKMKSVDFADVRDFIVGLRRRGFDVRLCTFDRWNSWDTMNILTNDYGIETDTLSVDKKHYDDFLSVMYDKRLIGPNVELLKTELKELRQLIRGTKVVVDHPRSGGKDLSDAVCGAIYNAVENTYRPQNQEVEVLTLKDLHKREQAAMMKDIESKHFGGVIAPPKRAEPDVKMPADIASFLNRTRIL